MNSIMNSIFILVIFMSFIALEYAYTIGDDFVASLNDKFTELGMTNSISTAAMESYANLRSMLYSIITGVMAPFLLLLAFGSSFINRNQDVVMYLVQVLGIIFITPLLIYMFSSVMTELLNVSILDSAYMATAYFDNFLLIMVLNMLLGIASFVFVKRGVSYEGY